MGPLSLSASTPLIIRHIFRPQPPSSLFSFRLSNPLQTTPLHGFFASLYSGPHSLSTFHTQTQTPLETETVTETETGADVEFESGDDPEEDIDSESSKKIATPWDSLKDKELLAKLPNLTVKEKKELASYAHSLGKKLKSQQVGKSGVTASVATALVETLESNELLKLKIHSNCPGELDDVVKQLQDSTGSLVVSRIGRTVILYRPSLTKLKAEEKKREVRRVFVRKPLVAKLPFQNRGTELRSSGRRGSSRY